MLLSAQVRVKRWGKSPPRLWRHRRQGKRRPEQDQIGGRPRAPVLTGAPGKRLARPRSPGGSQEDRGNSIPREMIAPAAGSI